MLYTLYNADQPVATFAYDKGVITEFNIAEAHLLPMQIRQASAEGFAQWLRERAIDLNTFLHRQLANELVGSRDKTAVAIMTHMFSVSDTFTCFPEGEFIPRNELCKVEDQDSVSDFILISSDTSLRNRNIATPNASTDHCWRLDGRVVAHLLSAIEEDFDLYRLRIHHHLAHQAASGEGRTPRTEAYASPGDDQQTGERGQGSFHDS